MKKLWMLGFLLLLTPLSTWAINSDDESNEETQQAFSPSKTRENLEKIAAQQQGDTAESSEKNREENATPFSLTSLDQLQKHLAQIEETHQENQTLFSPFASYPDDAPINKLFEELVKKSTVSAESFTYKETPPSLLYFKDWIPLVNSYLKGAPLPKSVHGTHHAYIPFKDGTFWLALSPYYVPESTQPGIEMLLSNFSQSTSEKTYILQREQNRENENEFNFSIRQRKKPIEVVATMLAAFSDFVDFLDP